MGCCLGGCFRLFFFTFWRLALAAITAIVLARVDDYVDGSEHRDGVTGRAWRAYRRTRGTKTVKRGTPPNAGNAIDTQGTPKG
ncbi:MAG TPA: hypothetical protein DCK98_02025 [Chloroflexi bacterium]|nr:hypothetical protein [Chloroflexota bacterium]HAL25328.1 hypothetical protein [Chloroflexota bacterium]